MAQSISVKRKQQTNKHAPLAIMLCLLFLLSSFSFSFADYTEGFLIAENGESYEISTSLWVTNRESETFYYAVVGTDLYACVKGDLRSSNLTLYTGSNTRIGVLNSYDTTYDFTYRNYSSQGTNANATLNSGLTRFSSKELFFDAVNTYLEGSSGSGSWSGSATVSVEAGCVAYILVDGGTASLTTTFPELSKLSRPLWTSGSTYSFENDLPSSGKVFSSTSGTLIDWLIPAGAKTDLLGRTYQAGRPLSDLPSGQYLVVYNPVYRGYNNNGVGIMSPTIYVHLSNYGAVRQFRLTASYNGGLIESTSEDGYTSWFDSIGEEELDANGNPIYVEHKTDGTTSTAISIPAGGGNIIVDNSNSDNSIGGLIQNILNLLSAPIKYIQNLYTSAVEFFNYLSSLWSWLPPEVTTIIGSALAVLVVIGVVKFLWK